MTVMEDSQEGQPDCVYLWYIRDSNGILHSDDASLDASLDASYCELVTNVA